MSMGINYPLRSVIIKSSNLNNLENDKYKKYPVS